MAGIIADMSEDIKKLQQVKAEIAGVKKELKSIDIRAVSYTHLTLPTIA